ncbi:DUF4363 family protein [Clostridium vincentii]|uniref:DUF4363 domain-containing protein n=1 Tax=Clostridium vincentii TaxID=52704 RepID=A0A2T0BLB8_9CLOT|nr:DUF4363 family protein [Clostridium vincentii]PRR84633.1 hypothetical protein CLVI_01560 [Clostridium vincentii]
MKNTLITIIIFSSLVCFVYYANYTLLNLCEDVVTICDDIEILINDGDFNEAYENSIILIDLIEKNSLLASVYIDHNDFDNLQDESLQLSIYTSCSDTTESLISVGTLKNAALNLIGLHKTNIKNIF